MSYRDKIISPSALQQLHTDVSTICPLAAFALEIFLIAIGIFPCAPRGHLSFAFCRFGISGCGCGFVWVAKLYHSSWSDSELHGSCSRCCCRCSGSCSCRFATSAAWQLSGRHWIQLGRLAKSETYGWPFDIITGHISSNWHWSINFFPLSPSRPLCLATLVALFLICNIHWHLQLPCCSVAVLQCCSVAGCRLLAAGCSLTVAVAVVFMLLIGNQFVVSFYDSQCVNVN